MSGRVRYSQIQINNGEVIDTHKSDWLEVPFDEALINIQGNVRNSYWDVVDTKDGVVHISINGLVTVWTVQIEP